MQEECSVVVLELAQLLKQRGMVCATAESCTGGMIGSMLTAVPGSSEWYAGGVISYANSVKTGVLGVCEADINKEGAVSSPVVESMAEGACRLTGADVSCSVRGVAGPGGGTPEKPVGTVWIGWCVHGKVCSAIFHFDGSRSSVRRQAAEAALRGMVERIRISG